MSGAIVPSRLRQLGRHTEEPPYVRQLREELRDKLKRVESTMLNLDNLVSPLDWLDAGDGFPGLGPWRMNRPVDRTMDRTHAPINYLNEQEWRLQFSMVRDLCVRNHLAIGFRDHVTNFVGPMKVSFVLRGQAPGTSVAAPQTADATGATAVDPLVALVQQFWDEWCEFAGWGEGADDREEECRRRLVVEGETTLRFFVGDSNSYGLPYARHIEPECIRTPPGHSTMDDWAWGLLARSDDENIEALWECRPDNVNDGKAVPISEWVRIKGNGDRTTRRGLSDFFPIGELLRKIGGLHGNMAHVARLQAAIAWWEKYPTATLSQLQNMVTLGQDYSRSKMPPNQSGSDTSVNSYEAGTVVRTEERDVLPGPVSQPNGFGQVEQMVMRGIGFRWGFPSFFSGDGADSFASVLVTGSPFVRMTEERQKKVKGFCCQVAKRVIEFGERSGRLPRGTSQRVRPVATAKPVVIADEEKKSRTFAAEFAVGVADPFEYMRSKGLDPKAVMANQAAFRKQMAAMGVTAAPAPAGPGTDVPAPAPPKSPTPAPPGSAGGDGSDSTADATDDIFGTSESIDVEEEDGEEDQDEIMEDITQAALEALGIDDVTESIFQEKHGSPPHPGLVFDTSKRRWVRPGQAGSGRTVAARAIPVGKARANSKPVQKLPRPLPVAKTPPVLPTPEVKQGAKSLWSRVPLIGRSAAVTRVARRVATALGRAVAARVENWADAKAAQYAPKIAKRLGVSEATARFALDRIITYLCRAAEKVGTHGSDRVFGSESLRQVTAESLADEALVRWLTERGFTGIDPHGHRWVNGKQVAKQDEPGAGKQTGTNTGQGAGGTGGMGATGGSSDAPPELSDEEKKGVADGIDKDVAELPEDERPDPGIVARAKDLAFTAIAKAMLFVNRIAVTRTFAVIGEAVDAILDSPIDMRKLGYNPNASSGTANPQVLDPVKNATGISGHLVASIASKVITKAVFYAKAKLAGAAAGEADESATAFSQWAEFISQLLAHLNEQFEIPSGAPDKATVEKALRELLKGKV